MSHLSSSSSVASGSGTGRVGDIKMTKEQIKAALIANGIQPPPMNAKKEVFVRMYEEALYGLPEQQPAGYSSDSESGSEVDDNASTVVLGNGDVHSPGAVQRIGDELIRSMSDAELREFCVNIFGPDQIGPVTANTRHVYENKAIAYNNAQAEQDFDDYQDEDQMNGSAVENGHGGMFSSDEEGDAFENAVENGVVGEDSGSGSDVEFVGVVEGSGSRPSSHRSVAPPPSPRRVASARRSVQPEPVNESGSVARQRGASRRSAPPTQPTGAARALALRRITEIAGNNAGASTAGGVSYYKERPGQESMSTSNSLRMKPNAKLQTTRPGSSNHDGPWINTAIKVAMVLAIIFVLAVIYYYREELGSYGGLREDPAEVDKLLEEIEKSEI